MAAGINIDLWVGIAMLAFAILMIAWALLRPVCPSRRRRGGGVGSAAPSPGYRSVRRRAPAT